MALDLNDPKAIDYSSSQDLFPYEINGVQVYGRFRLALLSYTESGPAGSESNKGDKEFDMATCRVVESSHPDIRVGSIYGFFFQTGGNGVTVENRAYKAAALREFHKAVLNIDPRDRAFDGNAARKTMLEEDLSDESNLVDFTRKQGKPAVDKKTKQPVYRTNKETGELLLDAEGNKIRLIYTDDVWSAAT